MSWFSSKKDTTKHKELQDTLDQSTLDSCVQELHTQLAGLDIHQANYLLYTVYAIAVHMNKLDIKQLTIDEIKQTQLYNDCGKLTIRLPHDGRI